jgi:transposase
VAPEATGNSDAIANLLTPLVGWVMVSNPSKTRAIAKVVTDEVGARILAQLLAADFRRRSGYLMSAPAHCGGR